MRLLLIFALGLGALIGVPMDPEKIRKLLEHVNKPIAEQTIPEKPDDGEDIEEFLRRNGLK